MRYAVYSLKTKFFTGTIYNELNDNIQNYLDESNEGVIEIDNSFEVFDKVDVNVPVYEVVSDRPDRNKSKHDFRHNEDKKFKKVSDEMFLGNIKKERNELLTKTDYLVMPDFPIIAKDLVVVKKYRQALRDLTDGKLPRVPKYLKEILS